MVVNEPKKGKRKERPKGGFFGVPHLTRTSASLTLFSSSTYTPETPPSTSTHTSSVSQGGTTVVLVCSQLTAGLHHPLSSISRRETEPCSHVSGGPETPPTCWNLAPLAAMDLPYKFGGRIRPKSPTTIIKFGS